MKRIFKYAIRVSKIHGASVIDPSDIETHANLCLTACGHRTLVFNAVFRVLGGDILATPVRSVNGQIWYRVFAPRVGEEMLWETTADLLLERGYIEIVENIRAVRLLA